MKYTAKVDRNQAEIISTLRRVGAHVYPTFRIGGGFPDLFVLYRDQPILMEVKSKGGKLNQEEQDFYREYQACTVIVYSSEDALRAIGAIV